MVDTWQTEPGGLPSKMKPMMMETQNQRVRATLKVLETQAKPEGREAKAKDGGLRRCRCAQGLRWCRREDGAKGVEGRITAEGLEVHGEGRATTDQGEAVGTRKPGGAVGTAVPGGAEEVRSHNVANRSTARGGVTGMEVLGGTNRSTIQG